MSFGYLDLFQVTDSSLRTWKKLTNVIVRSHGCCCFFSFFWSASPIELIPLNDLVPVQLNIMALGKFGSDEI